jgi:hypothetical protein
VWGGFDPGTGQALDDGAIYDPVDDAWESMATATEAARSAPIGAYAQERVVLWGGNDDNGDPVGGMAFYLPASDTWQQDDGVADPGALKDAAMAAGQQTFWVFGGRDASDVTNVEGWYYSFNSFDWHALDPTILVARWGAFGAFTNLGFCVWGGRDLDQLFDDGARHSLVSGFGSDWTQITEQGAPSPRYRNHRESGWAIEVDDAVLVIGGLDDPGSYLQDGGIYNPSNFSGGWSSIEAWPGTASHAYGAVGWVADELVIWGGRDGNSLTNTGVRYLP